MISPINLAPFCILRLQAQRRRLPLRTRPQRPQQQRLQSCKSMSYEIKHFRINELIYRAAAASADAKQQQYPHHRRPDMQHRPPHPGMPAGGFGPNGPGNYAAAAEAAAAAQFAAAAQHRLHEQNRIYCQLYDRMRAVQHSNAAIAAAAAAAASSSSSSASNIPTDGRRGSLSSVGTSGTRSSGIKRRHANSDSHLSGEMIRRLREQQKMRAAAERGGTAGVSTSTNSHNANSSGHHLHANSSTSSLFNAAAHHQSRQGGCRRSEHFP